MTKNYLNQDKKLIKFVGDFASTIDAIVGSIEGKEALSEGYLFYITFFSNAPLDKVKPFIGKNIGLWVGDGDKQGRFINGVVTVVEQEYRSDTHKYSYRITLESWLQTLVLTKNNRVYQNQTVADNVCSIFKQYGIADFQLLLGDKYEKQEYCIQYQESDFHFISRQLEAAGIFYYFIHQEDKHILVLADKLSFPHLPKTPLDGNTIKHLSQGVMGQEYGLSYWHQACQLTPLKVDVSGYSIPKVKQLSEIKNSHVKEGKPYLSIYQDTGSFGETNHLQDQAGCMIEQWESSASHAEAVNNYPGLIAGQQLDVTGLNQEKEQYIVEKQNLSITNNIENQSTEFTSKIQLIAFTSTYRPQRIHHYFPIVGVLCARVVGPSDEEIYTDDQGRIKLQFFWDSENNYNEKSSCWVRVSQGWSGNRFGTQFLPRVGNEVLVCFEQGNPDKPIVMGMAYNGTSHFPFSLADNKTQSGLVTRSSVGGANNQGHRLCFEDKKDNEFIEMSSQKDLLFNAKHDMQLAISHDVAWKITDNHQMDVGKNCVIEAKDKIEFNVGSNKVILSPTEFSVVVGESHFKLTNAAINCKIGSSDMTLNMSGATIKAPQITAQAQANLSLSGNAAAKLQGSMVEINGTGMAKVTSSGIMMVQGSLTKIG